MSFPEHSDRGKNLWGLVPVKSLANANQRLKACLGDNCLEFSMSMFMDVMSALKNSKKIKNIAIVTADPRVVGIAENHDLLVVDEIESMGLNPAVELGIEAIRRRGGQRVVILPTDIPLVTGAEIDRVLQELSIELKGNGADVVGISPAKNHEGTNFLCLDTSQSMPLSYGPDSYNRHLAIAAEHGLRPVTLLSKTIAIDIDRRRDIEEFIDYCLVNPRFQETATWRFLSQKGYINHSGNRRSG